MLGMHTEELMVMGGLMHPLLLVILIDQEINKVFFLIAYLFWL